MEETLRIRRDHPLPTPFGLLYAEVEPDGSVTVTSGRLEHNWETGRSLSLETMRVRRRDWYVQVTLREHGSGSFDIGKPGRPPRHSEWGDYLIAPVSSKMFDRWRKRKFRKAITSILEASRDAVNSWALGNDSPVVGDEADQRRRAAQFTARMKLSDVERELAELPRTRQALERREAVLLALREELSAALQPEDAVV